jgi:RimJ/RimL family protein N-acetyltransferase
MSSRKGIIPDTSIEPYRRTFCLSPVCLGWSLLTAAGSRDHHQVATAPMPATIHQRPVCWGTPTTHLPIDPRTAAEIDEVLEKRVGQHTLDEVGATVSLAVELAVDASYVGSVQLTPIQVDPIQASIGWLALRMHHRKGLMSEAVRAVVDVAFSEPSVHRIVAEIIGGNDASVRLAERSGFRKEAHFVESQFLRDQWRDETVYALLKSDWDA